MDPLGVPHTYMIHVWQNKYIADERDVVYGPQWQPLNFLVIIPTVSSDWINVHFQKGLSDIINISVNFKPVYVVICV